MKQICLEYHLRLKARIRKTILSRYFVLSVVTSDHTAVYPVSCLCLNSQYCKLWKNEWENWMGFLFVEAELNQCCVLWCGQKIAHASFYALFGYRYVDVCGLYVECLPFLTQCFQTTPTVLILHTKSFPDLQIVSLYSNIFKDNCKMYCRLLLELKLLTLLCVL